MVDLKMYGGRAGRFRRKELYKPFVHMYQSTISRHGRGVHSISQHRYLIFRCSYQAPDPASSENEAYPNAAIPKRKANLGTAYPPLLKPNAYPARLTRLAPRGIALEECVSTTTSLSLTSVIQIPLPHTSNHPSPVKCLRLGNGDLHAPDSAHNRRARHTLQQHAPTSALPRHQVCAYRRAFRQPRPPTLACDAVRCAELWVSFEMDNSRESVRLSQKEACC
jgi:hypothetical protein